MERRVLLAIFLSFLVIYMFQAYFVKPAPKPATGTVATQPATPRIDGGNGGPSSTVTPSVPAAPASPEASVLVGETNEREAIIETPQLTATFTNRGGRLKSWKLKRYRDQTGEPLELIANDLKESSTLPFSLEVEDGSISQTLNAALYTPSGPAPGSGAAGSSAVTFEYRDGNGLHAVKSFTIDGDNYIVNVRASVTAGERNLTPTIVWGPALGDRDSGAGRYAVKARGLISIADKVQRLAPADVTKLPTYQGDLQYAGVDDHYFMTVAVAPGASSVSFQHLSIPAAEGSKDPPRDLMSYAIKPERTDDLKFYVGPKDFDQLAAVDRPLVRAIDFGYFAFFVVPLLRALNWIHGYIGNYGWAIIILTVLINAAMFPLRHKSVVSMRKMQEIQPEAKAIQERYAKYKSTDPAKQKMNQELMALYRERGVNPASGCIPMLLTFPVLFAFYALLTTAIELRGAPFFGWIHDLSMPDPYYVTPILMGLSQIWQTRITPQAGADPAQQKMMMFMPIVFMFMFLWAPAGVAIYWLISNVWGIGQQYLTSYMIGPPNVRSMRPPAERQLKRAGSGKTEAAAREN
jgi:YidC/Oxa1 family membrane protein insertase